MRVGVVYNCDARDNGTAYHCRAGLEKIPGVEVVFIRRPSPQGHPDCDLYIQVDDGRDDISWTPPSPNVFYAIDTHLGYEQRAWWAKRFDKVYTAQKDGAATLRAEGVDASWLPLGCDPDKHLTFHELSERGRKMHMAWDVAFVGFINDAKGPGFKNRIDYLDTIRDNFSNIWFSSNVFWEDMSYRYANAKVGFNVSIKNDLNMRVFEVMSIGTPLVTNSDVEGIDDLFVEDKHYRGYRTPREAVAEVKWCLTNPGKAMEMAHAAYDLVRSQHTYQHRMKRVLEEFDARRKRSEESQRSDLCGDRREQVISD